MSGTVSTDEPVTPGADLTWKSLQEQVAAVASGEVGAVELLDAHHARIDAVNPLINAVVAEDREAARAAARAADALRSRLLAGGGAATDLPSLLGVPMTHKDTHDVAGLPTVKGSPLFVGNMTTTSSLIIDRLQAAGVVSTGKTNVPELAAGSHTFNSVFGTTVNPWDLTRSASGSSGGVAAVIAAGIQPAGDGSDMGGSLRTPASFTNTVGFRPSDGMIPHVPPEDSWQWLAQSGFMAREVSDVALLMSVASGPHPESPTARPAVCFDLPEFSDPSWEPSLAGVRVGFSPTLAGRLNVEPEVLAVVNAALPVFTDLGAIVDDTCVDLSDAAEVFFTQRAYDFAAWYGPLLRAHPDTFRDFVAWNIEAGLRLTVDDLLSKDAARVRLTVAVNSFFADHDVLVTATSQVLPFDASWDYPRAINGVPQENYLDWMRAATLISPTGCPAVSVPAGFARPVNGASGDPTAATAPEALPVPPLPVGIQIIGAPGRDVEVLRVARAFEAATGHGRRHPEL